MKWIATETEKINMPWIIGETGFAADLDTSPNSNTDWGSEEDQSQYAQFSMNLVKDCGGSGYSWWQYRDVHWGSPTQDYLGLYSRDGMKKQIVKDQTFLSASTRSECDCPTPFNYFNYHDFSAYNIKGQVVDKSNRPIKNAVIFGWENSDNTGAGFSTYSNATGQFNLNSNRPIKSIWISATGYKRITKDINSNSPLVLSGNHFLEKLVSCSGKLKFNSPENESFKPFTVRVFPNPTKNMAFIEANLEMDFLSIYDVQGRLINHFQVHANYAEFNFENVPSGLYFLKAFSGERVTTQKLIIEK